MLLTMLALLVAAGTAAADVYYVEEVVNAGFGSKKVGARKTTKQIYLKGKRQKVESRIETNKQTASALRKMRRARPWKKCQGWSTWAWNKLWIFRSW